MEIMQSHRGGAGTFLGLDGPFSDPSANMRLTIRPPDGKVAKWPQITLRGVTDGAIVRKDLERFICNYSSAQASVFGRSGRTMIKPLYGKLNGGRNQVNYQRRKGILV